MIEKYRMSQDHIRRCFRVVRFDNRTVAYCDKQDDAMKLCFQLNRLAALEAVCGEIVDDPHWQNVPTLPSSNIAFEQYHSGRADEENRIIEKLKAVLEEK